MAEAKKKADRHPTKPHLKAPWKPGESGNPKGRPPAGETLTDILRELGDIKDVNHHGEQIARKRALGHKMWSLALKGNETTMRYLYDRIDGKPTQEIKVGGNVKIDAPIYLHVGATIETVDEDEEEDDAETDNGEEV